MVVRAYPGAPRPSDEDRTDTVRRTALGGATCLQRRDAFSDLGHIVSNIDTEPPTVRRWSEAILGRVLYRIRVSGHVPGYSGVPDRAKANEQIIRAIQQGPFDLIWLDKGLAITGRTLAEVKRQQPRCRVVGYCCDDILNRSNHSLQFLSICDGTTCSLPRSHLTLTS